MTYVRKPSFSLNILYDLAHNERSFQSLIMREYMFSYELLNAFCATHEEESYSLAAKKIGKDRTTIREQVKALEESYDVCLFEVVGKKVKPTPEANHLYSHAKHIINSTTRLDVSFSYLHSKAPAELTIYHDIGLSNVLALKIEQQLLQSFPQLKTHWIHQDRQAAFSIIQNSQHSIAFMPHSNKGHLSPQAVDYCHIGYGNLGFFVGKKSKLRHIEGLTLDDLTLERQYIAKDLVNFSPELFVVSSQNHVISNNDMLFEMVKLSGWTTTFNELADPYVQRGELFEINVNELKNRAKLGLSLFYSLDLKASPILDVIRSISQTHYNDSL